MPLESGLVGVAAVGGIGSDIGRSVVGGDGVPEHAAIEHGCVGDLALPDEAEGPADRNAAFVAKAGVAMSTPGLPPGSGRALANFTVQRASVSFCAALAGSSGQISAAVLPALIASLSALVFRCLGAATSVASTI
jgi:hypothetical protein